MVTIQKTSVRNVLTPMTALGEAFDLYRYFPNFCKSININVNNITNSIEVPAITGSLFMIRKKHFVQLEGMDEKFFLHCEDLDLCKRVNVIGKIIYIPQVSAMHYLSTSDVSSAVIENYKRNSFIHYFNKHFKQDLLLKPLIMSIYVRYYLKLILIKFKKFFKLVKVHHESNRQSNYLNICKNIIANDFKNFDKPTMLVGPANQIGLSILSNLIETKAKIDCVYHKSIPNFYHPQLNWIQSDLNKLTQPIESEAEILIFTAPIWLLPLMLDNLPKKIKRIICFSSTSIITKNNSVNLQERSLVAKLIDAERQINEKCLMLRINYTIFRPSLVYGNGFDQNISQIINFITKYRFFPIYKQAKGYRQPVHVEDLAIGCLQALENINSYNKIYNLAGAEQITYLQMVERIFQRMNITPNIKSISFLPLILKIYSLLSNSNVNSQMAIRMNHNMIFDNSAASGDFNYQPRNFNFDLKLYQSDITS